LFEGNRKKMGFEGNSNMSRIQLLFVFLFLEKVVFRWCMSGIKERVGDDVILRGERETGQELEKGSRPRFQPRVGRRTRRVGGKERKEGKKFKEQLSECHNVT
jgi:hypothetical protein